MSEKMLVTQALDERDLLVKKISDKIDKASFVDTIKPNEDKVYSKRIGKDEYAKEAESAYQQIVDLIERFQKIDAGTIHFMDELPEYKEISDKYREEEKRLEEYRRKCKDEAIDMLKQYFYDLWD